MLNISEHNQYFVDKFLLIVGLISGGLGLSLSLVSAILALILQFTGLISFACFLIINHEKIVRESKKIIKKVFKRK